MDSQASLLSKPVQQESSGRQLVGGCALLLAASGASFLAGSRLGRPAEVWPEAIAPQQLPEEPTKEVVVQPVDGDFLLIKEVIKDPYADVGDENITDILLVDIPRDFDTRQEWFGCGAWVVDQGQCGDCWAASSANVMGDRACVHLTGDWEAIGLSRGGAYGLGATDRLFQVSGRCTGNGTDALAHQHGCKRTVFYPSPQALVSCGNVNNTDKPTLHGWPEGQGPKAGQSLYPDATGCNGGEAHDAWRFMYHEGVTIMDGTQIGGCTPYTSNLCSGNDPQNNGCRSCSGMDICADTGLKPQRVTVDSFGWIMEEDLPPRKCADNAGPNHDGNCAITAEPRPPSQLEAMKRQVKKMQVEMMTNGPLHVCIDDFANFGPFFNNHASGIYNSTEGSPQTGGHCIELLGWGVDRASGLPYWTFKNSWGHAWANAGYGRFLRGVDLCGIESDVWAMCPSNSGCKLTAGVVHNESWYPGEQELYATQRSHPTSAFRPSRKWHGGKEVQLSRAAFSHGLVEPLVLAAARHALGDHGLGADEALAMTDRVYTRSVRGLRARVQIRGVGQDVTVQRHYDGTIEVF